MKRLFVILVGLLLCLTACGEQTISCPAADHNENQKEETSQSGTVPHWSEAPRSTWVVKEDITLSLPQSIYPVGTDRFEITLENTGTQTMLYGESYTFQYHNGDDWENLDTIENYGFHMIGYQLGPGETQTLEVSPWMLTDPLPIGRCRIVGCALRVADGAEQLSHGGNYTEYEPYQLEFEIVEAESMPQVTDLTVEDTAFWLEIQQPEANAERISFAIYNESGRDAEILFIPTLEKKTTDENWQKVPFLEMVGFCGTPDPLPTGTKEWSVDTKYLWGDLEAGEYRLSYTVTDRDGNEFPAMGIFTIPYGLCGYPKVS